MRKLLKKIMSVATAFGLLCGFGVPLSNVFKASAGMEQSTAFENSYDNGALNDGEWEAVGTVIEADAGKKAGLRITDAYEGAGLVTQSEITANSVRVEADIEYLRIQSGGWMAFLLGTHDAPTIMNWSKINSGKYLLLSNINNVWYLNTQTKDENGDFKAYNFVNENGEEIHNQGDDGKHFHRLDLPSTDTLENVTLSLTLDTQGNMTFTTRTIGEAQTQEKILAKTGKIVYEPYEAGRLGFCVMQSSFGGAYGKFNDFRTYADGVEVTKFHFDREDVSADYLLDYSTKPNCLSFDAEGKLKMNATSENRAYAINKAPAYQDENVVNGALGKNLVFSQKLFMQDFTANNTFTIHFGMRNPYDTELGADRNYALKIGKTNFRFVKYDGAVEIPLVSDTPYTYDGEYCSVVLSIDGDGATEIVVGNTVVTANDVIFKRAKSYFAYELTGDGSIKVEETSVKNALYSKPYNKDLFADFKNDEINVNEWYLPSWGGNIDQRGDGVYAKNGKLVFKNVNSNAGITTKSQFSNFELSFDITDIERKPEGVRDVSYIGILYGISGFDDGFAWLYTAYKRPFITFRQNENVTTLTILNVEKELSVVLPEKFNMYSWVHEKEIFTVKVTMTDGLLQVFLKSSLDETFTEVASTQTSGATTGSIRVCGYGDGVKDECSNFSIDNLSVKNTDENPNNEEDFGFKSSKEWIEWDGYEYVDDWDNADLIPIEKSEESGCGSSVVGAALLPFAGVLAFGVIRRKRK